MTLASLAEFTTLLKRLESRLRFRVGVATRVATRLGLPKTTPTRVGVTFCFVTLDSKRLFWSLFDEYPVGNFLSKKYGKYM